MAATRRPPRGRTTAPPPTQPERRLVASDRPVKKEALPRAMAVSDLLRRLSEAESKLAQKDREHAADAELIGSLLGEVAERDRRLRDLETRSETGAKRTRELETTVARTRAVFEEMLRRLRDSGGQADGTSELHDLLAVTLAALDVTRTTTAESVRRIERTRDALSPLARDVEDSFAESLSRARIAHDGAGPADRLVARIIDRLRDIERRERELVGERDALMVDVDSLLEAVRDLHGDVGRLMGERRAAPTAPDTTRQRKRPSRVPTKRR